MDNPKQITSVVIGMIIIAIIFFIGKSFYNNLGNILSVKGIIFLVVLFSIYSTNKLLSQILPQFTLRGLVKLICVGILTYVEFLGLYTIYFHFRNFNIILTLIVSLVIIKWSIKLYLKGKLVSFSFSSIKELFVKTPLNQLESFTLKTNKGKIKIENIYRGIFIQGGAGSGKSESLIKPFIEQGIKQDFAYILYDFKGDLSIFEKQVLAANNIYKFQCIDFKRPEVSSRFNPIHPDEIKQTAEIIDFTRTLFYNLAPETIKSKDYFIDEAINVFVATVILFKNRFKSYCTIPHIITAFSVVPFNKLISYIEEDSEALPFISSIKKAVELEADKQIAGVLGSLQGNLAKITSKQTFWILSGHDFNSDINNKKNPQRLSIVNDSTLSEFYSPIIALIISVCIRRMNVENRHKSIVILDEAPTLYLPKFEQIPATARSNKIATVYAAQDYMQIVDKYGREKAQTIISNLGTQFFGRTTNTESIKLISELFGKYDKVYETRSSGTSSELFEFDKKYSKNKGESIQERYTVTSNEITNLNPGQFYGLLSQGKRKRILGNQFKSIKTKYEDLDLKQIEVSGSEMKSNYDNITNQVLSIFK